MLTPKCATLAFRCVSNAPLKSSTQAQKFDLVVVGGGIVGCATARELQINHPELKIAVVEKEEKLAAHQSGNNSGVLHAGIYYTPGSLKAKLCVEGIDLAYKFFDENKVPYKKVGKLIVAVEPDEIPRLDALYERAQKNGCRDISIVGGHQIKDYAPHCKGLKAIWSPHTGIVDWGEVTKFFAQDFEKKGGKAFTSFPVKDIKDTADPKYPIRLVSNPQLAEIYCSKLITCAGLQSDRVAKLTNGDVDPKIVPFRLASERNKTDSSGVAATGGDRNTELPAPFADRDILFGTAHGEGEYLLLKPEKRHMVTTNIYPVPDPRFPFLGVHFTPRMNGDIWLGPNAVLAYKREGYSYFDISPSDLMDSLGYSGMQKLMLKYASFGMKELYRGVFIGAQVKQLQRFIPDIKLSDVIRGPAGVRAQAMDSNGNLVDDFVFEGTSSILHVRNAPSPGATSSLAIAKMVAAEAQKKFGL